jgi:hypothetical protein
LVKLLIIPAGDLPFAAVVDSVKHRLLVRSQAEDIPDAIKATEALAESWVERCEQHRNLVYSLTNVALRKTVKCPPPVTSWADVERCDKAARRATGLDHEESPNISLGLQLVNQRIEAAHFDFAQGRVVRAEKRARRITPIRAVTKRQPVTRWHG